MHIVIDIPDNDYKSLVNPYQFNEYLCSRLKEIVRQGTPLPKGHGRLGDLDELEQRISNFVEHDANITDKYTVVRQRFIVDGIRETPTIIEADKGELIMLKEDYIEASKEKGPFVFSYTRPTLDWYEDVNVSLPYDKYNYLILELRYGEMWWLLGKKYIEDSKEWVCEQIGKIRETDIPRLVKWAEYTNKYGHKVSLLTNIRTIDGSLNPIREFLTIMSKYDKESE